MHERTFRQIAHYVHRLPQSAQWTLFMTEEGPATLNILVADSADRERCQHLLGLHGEPNAVGQGFETWGTKVLVSLVEAGFYRKDPEKESML